MSRSCLSSWWHRLPIGCCGWGKFWIWGDVCGNVRGERAEAQMNYPWLLLRGRKLREIC
ncbi:MULTISPECIES: hypothetical protein [Nostocaceae]|uniref:Uncharacterized protein n=1 Tax=Anabaena cylindrica FACHB-318 TaxID=2692880 RepID=A0ABR7ZP40_ANACY|nr:MULTISPECIES: hypothetical protein [Nostocaceae]MBD2174360.1 hypothetical protein [Anabaena cylindrica FACHB-318]MBD2286445.1 hypothetical protein [Anabaena cylindrica FACHB-170]